MDDKQREAWRERNRIREDYAARLSGCKTNDEIAKVMSEFESWAYAFGWNSAMDKIADLSAEWKR